MCRGKLTLHTILVVMSHGDVGIMLWGCVSLAGSEQRWYLLKILETRYHFPSITLTCFGVFDLSPKVPMEHLEL